MTTLSEAMTADPCRKCRPLECSYDLRRRLSLTRELQPNGCAHHYMGDILPELAKHTKSLNLPKGSLLAEAPKGWESFIGTAFDRRLRYEYEPSYTDSVITLGTERLGEKGQAVSEYLQSENLDERALYAAVADTQFRSGQGSKALHSLIDGGDTLKAQLIDDIQKLMELARDRLPMNNPKFGLTFGLSSVWIGGADCDIIDRRCLIDIKCVRRPEPTAFLRQVIAYALLDVENEYDLDSVGIYLARQGILWKVSLEDVAKWNGATLATLRNNAPWGNPSDREMIRSAIS